MEPYFQSMAGATCTGRGPEVEAPALSANAASAGLEVFVDLAGVIDIEAEIARKRKELKKLGGLIAGKQKKLANENFISRAPAEVVQRERESLAELEEQLAAIEAVLERLAKLQGRA
jgi:valyl-tRNA synthetase